VCIDARFLTVQEQIHAIQTSHAGIFAYQDPGQGSSGTIPLVLAAGRPVICTPFEYALDKQHELQAVVLADGFGSEAIAEGIVKLMRDWARYHQMARSLYRRTRHWVWGRVGQLYQAQFLLAVTGAQVYQTVEGSLEQG